MWLGGCSALFCPSSTPASRSCTHSTTSSGSYHALKYYMWWHCLQCPLLDRQQMWPCEAQLMDHLMSHKTEQSAELSSSAMLALLWRCKWSTMLLSKKIKCPASQKVAFLVSRGCHSLLFHGKASPHFFFFFLLQLLQLKVSRKKIPSLKMEVTRIMD